MEAGKWIRSLREQRRIKPRDVERITKNIASAKTISDFYVPHSTLADIEAGSVPSIHKLFSLAVCLKVPLNELLHVFGIEMSETVPTELEAPPLVITRATRTLPDSSRLHFEYSPDETTLLTHPPQKESVPFRRGRNELRFRYAVIGLDDDSMADLLPGGSMVEIDTAQNTVQTLPWRTLLERPVYLVRHSGGHMCRWCQVDGTELTVIPHPASRTIISRFRIPEEATILGRVTAAWLTFERVSVHDENASENAS